MKTIITIVLAIILFAHLSCENQDESAESKTIVEKPKMDLFSAVVLGDLEVIRQHVKAGSDLNVVEPSRLSTPLITAIAFGKTEAAKILIDAGADLNYQNNDGSTALHTAAFFCRVKIVKSLMEKGADKSLKNKMGRTALDVVEIPFEDFKVAYDAIGAQLKPAGFKIDYDHVKTARPRIAEILK